MGPDASHVAASRATYQTVTRQGRAPYGTSPLRCGGGRVDKRHYETCGPDTPAPLGTELPHLLPIPNRYQGKAGHGRTPELAATEGRPNRRTVPRLAPVCMVGTFPGIGATGDHTNRKTKRAQARNTMVWPIAPILSHFVTIARLPWKAQDFGELSQFFTIARLPWKRRKLWKLSQFFTIPKSQGYAP